MYFPDFSRIKVIVFKAVLLGNDTTIEIFFLISSWKFPSLKNLTWTITTIQSNMKNDEAQILNFRKENEIQSDLKCEKRMLLHTKRLINDTNF